MLNDQGKDADEFKMGGCDRASKTWWTFMIPTHETKKGQIQVRSQQALTNTGKEGVP
jgi:hypothetical protein